MGRIGAIVKSGKKWQYSAAHRANPTDVFRISGTAKILVRLEMSLLAYNLLLEEFPQSNEYLSKKDDKYIFDGWVCSFIGVGRFVLGLIGEVRVLEPLGFNSFLEEKIKSFTFTDIS